ncbi:LOW QUALITY PROTEIN: histone-lysine N-methyltransferase 2A [Pholidichthys leucotaenia]
MAASGGGLSPPATVAAQSPLTVARARFPGRPLTTRSRLRSEKRTKRGRLGSDDGELLSVGPRPVNIGLALSEDPFLLRLLGVTEKHRRRRDAGFESSSSEEEEDFIGFGTTTVRQKKQSLTAFQPPASQAKSPQHSERSPGAKPLIGKIIPKPPKPTLIGKIVPRFSKDDQGIKESLEKNKEIPKVLIKVQGKQVAEKVKHAEKEASGTQINTKSSDVIRKEGEAANSGKQNQSSAISASNTTEDEEESAVIDVEGTEEGQGKLKEGGKVSDDSDDKQSQTQRSEKRVTGVHVGQTRRASQPATLSLTSFHKRHRKKISKSMGASPEAGTEAGAQSGEEAAMPLACKDTNTAEKMARKRRKSLFGYRHKAEDVLPVKRSKGRPRIRRVFYTYVTEPVPSTSAQDANEQQIKGQNVASSLSQPGLLSEQIDQMSSNTETPVMSGRSSRVIKVPKRFLDDEIIPFSKGSLATWRKSQQREDRKPSAAFHESGYDGNLQQLDSNSGSISGSPCAVSKVSTKVSPVTSHLEIYKNLKKLTLKLAEKKKNESDTHGDFTQTSDSLTTRVRKRRRSKIMMEEMDSPGVVRKLAVVMNPDVEPTPHTSSEDTDNHNEADIVKCGASSVPLEVPGPSHRIGLSGANKRMLHLLKKAKVQLIKIDQQKQLKLSQLSSRETLVPGSGRRRRKRRIGLFPKEIPPQEQPLGGPRIKHVCRAAAVALGQPRAMVPDDIPRLSALPLHEREGITFSPAVEDVADEDDISDHDGDHWAVPQEIIQSRRGTALVVECQMITFISSSKKIFRKCDQIERRKMARILKPFKVQARGYSEAMLSGEDGNWSFEGAEEGSSLMEPGFRKKSLRPITPRSYSSLLKSETEDEEVDEDEDNADKLTRKSTVAAVGSKQDLTPQDGGSLPYDPLTEAARHRRLVSKSRPKVYKAQASAGDMEPRETLPEPTTSRSPVMKLQKQLHMHRPPDSVLQSAAPPIPQWSFQRVDGCVAQSHPSQFQLVTQPTVSEPSHSTTNFPPDLLQSEMDHSSPLSTPSKADLQQKTLVLCLHRLPQSLVQSALHKSILLSDYKYLESTLNSTAAASSQLFSQEHPKSEVKHCNIKMDTDRLNTVQNEQTELLCLPHPVECKEDMKEEQEEKRWEPPKEDNVDSVKQTVLQKRPTTDSHYVLRSQNPAESSSLNSMAGLTNGFPQKGVLQNKHKIRVDFKEDCAVQNVWLMGGLSVLTSIPTTPQPVCLLCASKGQHEMIFCQICCEPFHSFCLSTEERPQEENKENWCCRRCKFCHVCGRRSKSSKPVLQCRRCQTSYHPSCLGPTYPKPINCSIPWVCMTCIRCKSCGVTPGKTWDLAWNHKEDLCPDCTSLCNKGNFCTVCHKCYEDESQTSQMIQCSKCSHWVHYKCEGLSDELYGLLSSLPDKVDFTCRPCRENEPSSLKESLQSRLMAGMEEVLNNLLSSSSTQHLISCKVCQESDVIQSVKDEQPVCDLRAVEKKFQGGSYTSIKSFHVDVASLMRQRLKEEEVLLKDQGPTIQSRTDYIKVMEQVFSWCNLKRWNSFSENSQGSSSPPSKEHSYAQWLERANTGKTDSWLILSQCTAKLVPKITWYGNCHKADDTRQCALCQQWGDSAPSEAGRLLYIENEWAHVNCCRWSAEVREKKGALLQVHSAVSRGRHLRCDYCGQSGATVGCCLTTCLSNYHFMCARAQKCVFQEDKKVYCHKHQDLASVKVVSGKGFEVPRRVYVDFDGINLRKKFLTGLDPECINMTIGSLQIQKLGVLTELSSNGRMLYPVGYQCSRLYWSTVDPRRRCKYTCKVMEVSTPLPEEEHDLRLDKEENHTIVHSPSQQRDLESPDILSSPSSPVKSSTTPNSKLHSLPRSKSPGYSQARRPAEDHPGPLPSPGTAPPTHHIVTLRDLEETRRPRKLSSRSRCSSSPTDSDPSVPMIRSGGIITSRCNLFVPPRSNLGCPSPPLSRQNSTSPVWSSPPRSNLSISPGLSPRQRAITHSPRGRQNFKITTPVSAEVPQDFLASAEAEDAAVATTNGISLAPDNLEEDVVHLMAQELPYTVFDTDTEVAVASMLNAKLEFDEALLTENVTQEEDLVKDVEMHEDIQNDSEGEGSSHYEIFTHGGVVTQIVAWRQLVSPRQHTSLSWMGQTTIQTVVRATRLMIILRDTGEEDDEGGVLNSTPTRQLAVSLKRLESNDTAPKLKIDHETIECLSLSANLESSYNNNGLSIQEEVAPMASEDPSSQNEMMLDSVTGRFVSTADGYKNENIINDFEGSTTSGDSDDGDDLNDPDYSPEYPTKRSPVASMKTTFVKSKPLLPNIKHFPSKPCVPLQPKSTVPSPTPPGLTINSASVSATPARFLTVPRPVTSPIIINGLNTSNIQQGVAQGRTITIRMATPQLGSQQQVVTPNQTGAANSPLAQAPPPQVLLVNRQGQILVKDPKSNTYQQLSAHSPAYTKISQIAKILHSSNTPRTVPRVVIKSRPITPVVNVPAVNNPSTSEKKIIVRVLPIKSGDAAALRAPAALAAPAAPAALAAPAAPVLVQSTPEASIPNNTEGGTTQAIIDTAMAIHRESPKTTPIILTRTNSPKVGHKRQLQVVNAGDLDQSSMGTMRIKRVSSVSERPSRKKSKLNFLKDPSNEPEEESRVRTITPPSLHHFLNQPATFVQRLHLHPHKTENPKVSFEGKTHKWVSARHGDLTEWGPYTGISSEDDAPVPKQKPKGYMNQPHLRFEITSEDGFSVKANSIEVAWRAVIDGVLEARAGFQLKQLPLGGMSGPRVLGIVHDAVIFLLEQLQGAANCKCHRFRFHRCDDVEEELPLNPSGCARAEVYTRKATFDMFNFLASQHRPLPDLVGPFDEEEDEFPLKSSRRATSIDLPMAMRFRHLEKLSKEAVGVYRSPIHGRLFCKRNIESGEMVIEYAGTVIRSVLTDKREKYYDSKGIGCYMFRIDDFEVVDATVQGNAARFINHSCEPNCYSRVISIDGRKHIVIFALRKIYRGEELTYDYKFPIEDESNKLHCNCGARRCRRFLN